ncbi:MAG: hypothetical protein E4H14_12255, partial [Candidatus Thorarchaeota archaeon]
MNQKRVGLLLILSFLMLSVAVTSTADACRFHWRWRVHNPAPVINITNPENGEFVSDLVTISFTAVDDNRIRWHQIIIDGLVRSWTTSYDWNTTTESEGIHTITCRAMDSAW